VVDREEGDPDTTEHQHAERQELGFIGSKSTSTIGSE
jgi:hypothetical protein